ncbi:GTP-binding protein [Alteromonas sp. ALT199]|uniref:CobW family GTP-binding protein n=1 Tax=unclassified Alteromonas TaxID=2614992 RepID=UPI000445B311|nr:GTP-binding protein [Alteromonas sp. ALT199]MBT3136745.1 GTP-binding protein [Alteromonas sp. ALT199]
MIKAVPTNIITGFLGVGKTSALLHLLEQKPSNECWAILINEFGEIGIDGALVKGTYSNNKSNPDNVQKIFIKEVPGGCMCCSAGLPMQIALNQLLAQSKPDRLLIEPTGLGHPVEVMQTLSAEHYQDVLDIQRTITLVDARKLSDPRYTSHATFNQQIDIGDVIVGNKCDLYGENEEENLKRYVVKRGKPTTPVILCEHGVLPFAILQGKSEALVEMKAHAHHHHNSEPSPSINEQAFPDSGFLKIENEGEGFKAVGWRFSPSIEFNRYALLAWINKLEVERLKAVMITSAGIFSYNLADGNLVERELSECAESKIEIIAANVNTKWDAELADCVITN